MTRPKLGHAYIVNNVAREFAGSVVDAEAMKLAFERMGLEVEELEGCTQKVSTSRRDVIIT